MSATERRTSTISDVQARSPNVALSLSRVGVTGVENEMVRGVVDGQTLHHHRVVAERSGTFEEIRAEPATGTPPTHTSRQARLVATP